MLARVLREVDPLGGDPHRTQRGLHARVRRGDEREYGAVVRRVRLDVEETDAGDAREGRAQRRDGRRVATFGKIRHAFDEGGGHWNP
jgi:hypothetical protein